MVRRAKPWGRCSRQEADIVVAAGVLEIIIGGIEAYRAAEKHDYVGETSAAITITGAAISTVGFVVAAGLEISAGPFMVIGLVVMSIGAIVGLFKDKPMDTYLKFCAFGENGGGGEIVPGLEEMKEGEYLQQLEVLLNLICAFEMERADLVRTDGDPRAARFTMGWFTENSYMDVDYEDEWYAGAAEGRLPRAPQTAELRPRGCSIDP